MRRPDRTKIERLGIKRESTPQQKQPAQELSEAFAAMWSTQPAPGGVRWQQPLGCRCSGEMPRDRRCPQCRWRYCAECAPDDGSCPRCGRGMGRQTTKS